MKCISTRMNTVAFLVSMDLWQRVVWNRVNRDGNTFLREAMGILSKRTTIVLSVDSNAGGLPLSFKSTSMVNGSKCSKQDSASALRKRFASARSAVWTISNGASFVHFGE